MGEQVVMKRALISVSDKTGLVELAQGLVAHGIELVSTGGTARALADAGVSVRDVSDLTQSPEMMDGRVKTLHPAVHGGLLALRDDPAHQAAMTAHGIGAIDLLVVNLYPFEATLARGADADEIIENIDIGGPAMLRSAAKNHAFVTVVTDTEDYADLLAELAAHGGATSMGFRTRMAMTAFGRTAAYDAAVSGWFASKSDTLPRRHVIAGEAGRALRYGENPHQSAALYARPSDAGPAPARAEQIQGKELSFNNLADAEAAFQLVSELGQSDAPAVAIIKHANPCGVARGTTLLEAYTRAYDCDRQSAFGGIIALSKPLDLPTAEAITTIFTEVVIAPDASQAARAVFQAKPNLRLLLTGGLADPTRSVREAKLISGALLVQDNDSLIEDESGWRVVTTRPPSDSEMTDLRFAWRVAKHVKSNAIIYAKSGATVGIGAGQMSRIDSTRIAARKAADMAEALGLGEAPTKGSVVASDAFFPFADGLLAAAEAGATAVIHPGGGMRDAEIIAAADRAGLAMVLTGRRHFRH